MSITLSSGVRQNLLSLQNTSDLMAKTQNRLATGKKVNSALDNPTNFFTASSLNSRASDLSNLLDSMSNGIKTLEAADNGLKSITRTVESLQSTVRQARQDNSFKSATVGIASNATGNITFSGGSLTSTQSIALSSGPTQSTVSAAADYQAPTAATAGRFTSGTFTGVNFDNAGDEITFNIAVDGGAATAVTINKTRADAATTGNDGNMDTIAEFQSAVQASLTAAGVTGVTVGNNGTQLTFTSNTTGASSAVAVTGAAFTDGGGANTLASAAGLAGGSSTAGAAAVNRTFTISNGSATANISLTSSNAANAAAARNEIATQLSAQGVSGITVGGSGNRIDLAGAAGGTNSVTVGGAGADAVFGVGRTVTAGSTDTPVSVDSLVSSINGNTALAAAGIRASNTDGKLKVTFESTSTTDLTIGGLDTAGTNATGGSGTSTVKGNEIRRSLETQFNELRTQLNRLADDSSFNGINLLKGDQLQVNFNESSTSSLTIKSTASSGINTTTLGIETAAAGSFASNASLDDISTDLGNALGTLRSQSSAFGSNLSVVQNRIDFTKSTINTLKTGSDNLTLADMNEEAANLLSLQTRQQLSSTALSLASQADQGVLRLF